MSREKIIVTWQYPRHGETTALAGELQARVRNRATSLATQLGLPMVENLDEQHANYDFALLVSPQNLSLITAGHLVPGPVRVDFNSSLINYRVKNAINSQAIAKAVGIKPGIVLSVLDATAGFGKDAYLLASLGCQVIMTERHPVIHALLADGIRCARESADKRIRTAVERMVLYLGDFKQFIHTQPENGFDVVYLDPMFPKRTKSARVKKDMFVLQQFFAGQVAEGDEDKLLIPALALARKRVVVKRSKRADFLAGATPSHVLAGRSSRYDVYLTG